MYIGIYVLDVNSIHDIFSQLKLKIDAENNIIKVAEYKYTGSRRLIHTYPIDLTSIATVTYFKTHAPFSIWGLIAGNPMIIMMLFSLIIIIVLPMLLSGLSEEELKEIQDNNKMTSIQSMLGIGGTAGAAGAGAEGKTEEDD